MAYYIYKYVENNVPVYIGKTTQLDNRIKQHTRDKLRNFSGKIYYFECPNKTSMDSYEYCLINKYHPIYNTALKDKNINTNITEPEWRLYQQISNNVVYLKDYRSKNITPSNNEETIILKGRSYKTFTCRHCEARFKTINWYKTKTGFGSICPECHYSAWTRR